MELDVINGLCYLNIQTRAKPPLTLMKNKISLAGRPWFSLQKSYMLSHLYPLYDFIKTSLYKLGVFQQENMTQNKHD